MAIYENSKGLSLRAGHAHLARRVLSNREWSRKRWRQATRTRVEARAQNEIWDYNGWMQHKFQWTRLLIALFFQMWASISNSKFVLRNQLIPFTCLFWFSLGILPLFANQSYVMGIYRKGILLSYNIIRNQLIFISCFDSWLSQSTTIRTVLRLKSNCLFHTCPSHLHLFLLRHSLVAPPRHACMSSYIPSLRLLHSRLSSSHDSYYRRPQYQKGYELVSRARLCGYHLTLYVCICVFASTLAAST